MLSQVLRFVFWLKSRFEERRLETRWETLRALGMHIGRRVALPASTWIDESHCFLISIGDDCGFGERCLILAHDAQMNEFLGATRVGRVVIHPSCHIGAGTVILPGVEIGPRTIVSVGSVISRSLPPDTVCAGVPARVICSLDEYLDQQRGRIEKCPHFPYEQFKDVRAIPAEQKAEMARAVMNGDAYIVGSSYNTKLHSGSHVKVTHQPD